MRIELINDFHNTYVTINAKNGKLSAGQMRHAKKTLCGISGCCCSGDFGYRGHQDGFDGIEAIYDSRIGLTVGGIVHFVGED